MRSTHNFAPQVHYHIKQAGDDWPLFHVDKNSGGWVDGWMDGWVDGWMDGWVNEWMDGWGMGGWMDGWEDGWVDEWLFLKKSPTLKPPHPLKPSHPLKPPHPQISPPPPPPGMITSRASFDREKRSQYFITVVAQDGAPSDRPNHFPPATPNTGGGCFGGKGCF